MDYVCPGTVVGVKDGILQTSNGGFVRDDRAYMKDLAYLAYQWYGVVRRAFSLTYHQLSTLFVPGMLITQIGSGATLESVRSVITKVGYDFRQGTTSIHTQYAELDVTAL